MPELIFPAELLSPDRKDDVLKFIAALPVPPPRRKRALQRWADLVGAVIDRDDVEEVTGVTGI